MPAYNVLSPDASIGYFSMCHWKTPLLHLKFWMLQPVIIVFSFGRKPSVMLPCSFMTSMEGTLWPFSGGRRHSNRSRSRWDLRVSLFLFCVLCVKYICSWSPKCVLMNQFFFYNLTFIYLWISTLPFCKLANSFRQFPIFMLGVSGQRSRLVTLATNCFQLPRNAGLWIGRLSFFKLTPVF